MRAAWAPRRSLKPLLSISRVMSRELEHYEISVIRQRLQYWRSRLQSRVLNLLQRIEPRRHSMHNSGIGIELVSSHRLSQ